MRSNLLLVVLVVGATALAHPATKRPPKQNSNSDSPDYATIETIKNVERSVVPVVCGYLDEYGAFKVSFVSGSGFFVDNQGRFITAGQVVEKTSWDKMVVQRHACRPVIYIPDRGWSAGFVGTIPVQYFWMGECESDNVFDLAVCSLVENPFKSSRVPSDNISYVSFDSNQALEGTPVAFTGFPLEYTTPVSSMGYVAGFVGSGPNNETYAYVVDKNTWPGASGSPLYVGSGKVIGLMRLGGRDLAAGIGVAISATTISDFLSKHPAAKK